MIYRDIVKVKQLVKYLVKYMVLALGTSNWC